MDVEVVLQIGKCSSSYFTLPHPANKCLCSTSTTANAYLQSSQLTKDRRDKKEQRICIYIFHVFSNSCRLDWQISTARCYLICFLYFLYASACCIGWGIEKSDIPRSIFSTLILSFVMYYMAAGNLRQNWAKRLSTSAWLDWVSGRVPGGCSQLCTNIHLSPFYLGSVQVLGDALYAHPVHIYVWLEP